MTATTQANHTPEQGRDYHGSRAETEIRTLIQQRDALAAVLRQIIQWADPGPQPTYSDNMRDIEAAWAALASLGK